MMILLLGASALVQRELNKQRGDPKLGLTRVAPLENAPPVLAFTTVALGGFRGLIANALWIRANELQNDGKYFEMVQLADWITKLEPTFVQVWIVQAWNMAYNISVKFPDAADRWRWVQRGIELLRDEALRYNPKEALVYRELAWFFQHKMGQNLDDAHNYYKQSWAIAMTNVFGGPKPNFQELLNPTTPEARARAGELRARYKIDPRIMREVDQAYGPLEWRLPEAHAMYWAHVGLKLSKKQDLITLRRVIYQSMQVSVLRGKLVSIDPLVFAPDLDKAERANAAYEKMITEETELKQAVQTAHRNFLRELVYLCYAHGRNPDANRWFSLLKEKYPDMVKPGLTMEQFSLERLEKNIADAGQVRTQAILEGLLRQHYYALALDQDEYADGMDRMAQYLWNFHAQRAALRQNAISLPPIPQMKARILEEILKPDGALPPRLQDRLRTRTGQPPPAPPRQEKAPAVSLP
ncbi:MAG TPA: hypothetical protein VK615_13070 [Candidatus Binatia bacterium]|nr:hypothetical protein [Candidatus Binatia bacterium]